MAIPGVNAQHGRGCCGGGGRRECKQPSVCMKGKGGYCKEPGAPSGAEVFTNLGDAVKARKTAFHNPRQLLPCHAGELQVHLLDAATLHLQASWQLPSTCTTAAISPNGCLLASANHSQPLRNSPALHSAAEDSDTDGRRRVQNHARPGPKNTQEGLTDPSGSANVSFSMLVTSAQQALATAKSVGTSEQGQGSMDIDIVSCSF